MKTALVTGSTSGIGLQIGTDLLKQGWSVTFNGRNVPSMVEIDNIAGTNLPRFSFIKADCSSIEAVKQIFPYTSYHALTALILNVGMTDRTPFKDIKYETWNKVIDTNLTVPFFIVQSLLPYIRNKGKIIFITSISGIVPDSVSIAYGVSKAATNMMVKYLAKETAHQEITVNAVAPGYTDTPWHENKNEGQINRISKKTLANRFATTKEISNAVQFILNNDYVNGQVIAVDGGFGLV